MKAVLVLEEGEKAHVEYQGDNSTFSHGTSVSKQEAIDFAIAWARNEVEYCETRIEETQHRLEIAKQKLALAEGLNG